MSTVRCTLRPHREALGLSQGALGTRVGVSRQAVQAIEAGRQVPSTALALRLAQVLGCRVEDLFALPPSAPVAVPAASLREGERVRLGEVDGRWVAHPAGPATEAADGVVSGVAPGQVTVSPLVGEEALGRTVLVAGCAPVLGALGQRLGQRYADSRLCWVPASSQHALDLLAAGLVHVAGLHLAPADGAEVHAQLLRERLPGRRWLLVHLVRWRQGLVVPRGNPLGLASGQDLRRPALRLARREAGAGAQKLALRLLDGAPMPEGPRGDGHAEIAQLVRFGAADTGIAIESEALAAGLDFVPLSEERFDLMMPASLAASPSVARLLDVLTAGGFSADISALAGYDAGLTGAHLEVQA